MKSLTNSLAGILLATTALSVPGMAIGQDASPAVQSPDEEQVSEVEEIVVLGRNIPEPNRESPEVAAFLTAEDLARTGDSNAAEALTRVTGLSIVEGRFVYVRGLGERYSSALLNGSPLPSPEPLQRVVPLDLFPSEMLAGVTVQKSYSVQYPGEFGGGVIDMTTINSPPYPFITLQASTGGNTETTGKDGLIYFGSRTDFTSFDDGTRDVPGQIEAAFASGEAINLANYTATEVRHMGQALVNAPLRLLQRDTIPANFGLRATGGASRETDMGELGALFVASYGNNWRSRAGVRQNGFTDAGVFQVRDDYTFASTQNDLSLNLLVGLGLENETNELRWTNLYVRNVTKEARTQAGFSGDSGAERRTDYTEWFARQLFSSQLTGEHEFADGAWELDWRAAYAKTSRDAPYETQFGYGVSAEGAYVHDLQTNLIKFSELDDEVISGGADLRYTLPLSDYREAVFSFGVASMNNERSAEERRLRFIAPNGLTQDQRESRVDFLFSDINIGPYLQLEEITGSGGTPAAYDASLTVHAAYAQVEAEIVPLVNLTAGVRFEDAEQEVLPRDLVGEGTPFNPTRIEEQYWLPAATLTWNFAEDMQFRIAASKTLGRPQFRELAPQQYTDPESDRTFVGNPYLVDTEILNLDARVEWYFANQQYVTAGLFYKDLDKPVETSVLDEGSSISQTFLNAPSATVMGVELEVKKYFEFPDVSTRFFSDKRWLVQANYTYSDSEVQVEDGDTVIVQNSLGVPQPASFYVIDGSRLQGQSEHVANLQLGWEDDEARSQATLILNVVSERTAARGRPGEPDLIQEPGVMVDFVYRKDFDMMGRELGLAVELRNLLDESFLEYQERGNRVITNGYDLGFSGSVSLTARF